MTSWQNWLPGTRPFRKNVAIKQSNMLAYRDPSNWVPESFGHTLKLNAYITPTIAQDFLKTMTDEKVNLKKYFKMKAVLERAERFKAKRHRIECYSRIMNVDIKVAYHLYCLDEKQAENDMWNTVYEKTLGADYKEKYPIRHTTTKAYYVDKQGILRDIRFDRDRKQYYLYGDGVKFK